MNGVRRTLIPAAAAIVAVVMTGCAGLWPGARVELPLAARVVRISEEFANINTDLAGAHLAQAGITVGTTFQALHGQTRFDVYLGTGYGDVDRGRWVGLIEEDGNLQVAVSFGHAADSLGCAVGDTLYITSIVTR